MVAKLIPSAGVISTAFGWEFLGHSGFLACGLGFCVQRFFLVKTFIHSSSFVEVSDLSTSGFLGELSFTGVSANLKQGLRSFYLSPGERRYLDQQISDRRQGPREPIQACSMKILIILRRRGAMIMRRPWKSSITI